MDANEMSKKAVASMLANHGLVIDNIGQDNKLAAGQRDKILSSLEAQGKLGDFEGASVISIHAYNPQVGAIFFNNGKLLLTFQMAPDQPWQLNEVTTWEGSTADPYDIDSIDVGDNVQMPDPRLFVFIGKDGEPTAAGREGKYTS